MAVNDNNLLLPISFSDKGFDKIQAAYEKAVKETENVYFTEKELEGYRTLVAKCSKDMNEKMYQMYEAFFGLYLTDKVFPVLEDKRGEEFLQALVQMWAAHKVLTARLMDIFKQLDTSFCKAARVPGLQSASYLSFCKEVYGNWNYRVINAIVPMINRHRDGEKIDQELVKKVTMIYEEMGGKGLPGRYCKEFKQALLEESAKYYRTKVTSYLEDEKHRATYLIGCKTKLVEGTKEGLKLTRRMLC